MAQVIVDTGPLVALLDEDDKDHAWATEQSLLLPEPVITCDAVLTEAFFLISRNVIPGRHFRRLLRDGKIISKFPSHMHVDRILELMETYSNIPMSFADASLVCMVENTPGSTLFTLDRDFTVYRQQRRRLIPLIVPF
jgi:uncharacterized protein